MKKLLLLLMLSVAAFGCQKTAYQKLNGTWKMSQSKTALLDYIYTYDNGKLKRITTSTENHNSLFQPYQSVTECTYELSNDILTLNYPERKVAYKLTFISNDEIILSPYKLIFPTEQEEKEYIKKEEENAKTSNLPYVPFSQLSGMKFIRSDD